MNRKACSVAAVLFLAVGLAAAQEKVTLRQTYAPGDYGLSMTMKMDGQTTITIGESAQPAMEQKTTMTLTAAMSVSEPDKDGVKKASFTYRRIALHTTAGPVDMQYDSDDPNTASSPMASAMKPLIGAQISFEMTADGNIRNVKGFDEMWDAMAKENPRMAAMTAQMKKEFGTDQLQNMMMSSAAGYFPAGAVAVGETWKSSIRMKAPVIGAMTTEANCRLAGVEKGLALIDFDSRGGIDKPTETKVGENAVTIQRMDMAQKGRLTFDRARNMISGATTTGDISMDMTMDGPNGQKVVTTTKQSLQMDMTIAPAKGAATPAPAKDAATPAPK